MAGVHDLSTGEVRARLLQRGYDPRWVEWACTYRDRPHVTAMLDRILSR